MACNACGGPTKCVETTGGIESGHFYERYECQQCGATGSVQGESSNPTGWSYNGCVAE